MRGRQTKCKHKSEVEARTIYQNVPNMTLTIVCGCVCMLPSTETQNIEIALQPIMVFLCLEVVVFTIICILDFFFWGGRFVLLSFPLDVSLRFAFSANWMQSVRLVWLDSNADKKRANEKVQIASFSGSKRMDGWIVCCSLTSPPILHTLFDSLKYLSENKGLTSWLAGWLELTVDSFDFYVLRSALLHHATLERREQHTNIERDSNTEEKCHMINNIRKL